jgi:hypothetical protein
MAEEAVAAGAVVDDTSEGEVDSGCGSDMRVSPARASPKNH